MSNYSYSVDEQSESDSIDSDEISMADKSGSRTPQRTLSQDDHLTIPPSSGPRRSSPITGNAEERKAKRARKAQNRRRETFQKHKDSRKTQEDHQRKAALDEVLDLLHAKGLKFWDLLEYMFNPENGMGTIRFNEFFIKKRRTTQIIEWWLSPENRSRGAKAEIRNWIVDYAAVRMFHEARAVTRSKKLQTMGQTIDSQVVKEFSFEKIFAMLQEPLFAPFSMRLLQAFTTSRNAKKHTENRRQRTKMVITTAALICLGEYSHSNNLAKRMIGLYLYASGAQRQCITVLSTLGLSESYTNLMSKNPRRKRKTKPVNDDPFIDMPAEPSTTELQRTGTVYQLSDNMRTRARELATTGLFSVVYDNININFRNAEQVIGRHDSQENGTCATVIPLFDATVEDLDLKKFQSAYLEAPLLNLEDIIHTRDEQKQFRYNLIHTILRVIVKHGGPGFNKFEKDLAKNEPITTGKIPVHKTDLHPLPSWNIDESSIVGNAEVDEAIVKELCLDPEASGHVRFLGGDQLSIARLRALEFIRAGQEEGYEGFFWGAWIPGLFHAKMADAHGTLINHFGKPDSGSRNPGSLGFQNTRLDRLPITLTSLPTYRTVRDLIFVSLYARVLHCLLLISNYNSLEEYSLKVVKWETLVQHVTDIFDKFANSRIVEELRMAREESLADSDKDEGPDPTEGDAVFENASLFLRDALISREFNDAVKSGDSGRVVLVLKMWALSFRGNGRTKYAYEMLHLIHNLTNVWPKPIRDSEIVLKNWLLNPSGLPNRFVEMDLVQEHLNFRVKISYKARGSNASWEWLETISPCVVALGDLQKAFNDTLGGDQGMKHAPPDLRSDIQSLMNSLDEHKVYRILKGRMLKDDELAKDVIGVGLQNLTTGDKNPLAEYNGALRRLQKRRNMNPVTLTVVQEPSELTAHPSTPQPRPPTSETSVTLSTVLDEVVEDDKGSSIPEELNEIEQILDDLERGLVEESLPCLTEDDVAYDMDEVLVEDDADVDSEESNASDEGDSDIYWEEENDE